MLDIGSLAAQRADSLSGGQQQRVAIARALVQEPRIILADEPIASLDPRNTKVVMDALLRINKHFGITVLCNLHSLDLARSYCDRLVGMAAGRVVFDDAPAALTDDVARELYGLEAGDVLDAAPASCPGAIRRGRRRLNAARPPGPPASVPNDPQNGANHVQPPHDPRRRRDPRRRHHRHQRLRARLEGEISRADLRGRSRRERLGRVGSLRSVHCPTSPRNSASP